MPRYRARKNEKRTFAKQFPDTDDLHKWTVFAARLKPEHLKS